MVKRPFSELPSILRSRAREIEAGTTRIMKAGAKEAVTAAVEGTPVDTGKARSNWVTTLNNPFGGEIPPYAPGAKLGIGESANASAAKSQGSTAIGKFNSVIHKSIHITNNVAYIRKLNTPPGHSQQGPPLFAQAAAQRAAKLMRSLSVFKGKNG